MPNHQHDKRSLVKDWLMLLTVLCVIAVCRQSSLSSTPKGFPRIVWMYWEQGFGAYDLLTEGLNRNNKEHLSGYDVRILDSMTVLPWIKQAGFDEIPDLQIFKSHSSFRANFVRIVLLRHFGGIWMDYQIILLQHMDWVQKLQSDPKVVNKHGSEPDVFMFHLPTYGSTHQYYDEVDMQKYKQSPGLQISFMAAKPDSKLFNDWFKFYLEGLENTQLYKSPFSAKKEHYISYMVQKQGVEVNLMNQFGDYLIAGKCLQVLLQVKQKQYDKQYQEKLKLEEPSKGFLAPQKQLSVKYYGVWSISQFDGPLTLRFEKDWDDYRFSQLFAQKDIEEIKEQHLFPSYLIKANSHTFEYFQGWVTPLTLSNYLSSSIQRKNILIKRFWCPGSFNIAENSLLNRLLIQKATHPLRNVIIQKQPHTELCDIDYWAVFHLQLAVMIVGLIVLAFFSGLTGISASKKKKYHHSPI